MITHDKLPVLKWKMRVGLPRKTCEVRRGWRAARQNAAAWQHTQKPPYLRYIYNNNDLDREASTAAQ